jgi:hypothetical protein
VAEERSGFLGRWSRRKADALQGKPLEERAAPAKSAPGIALAASPDAPVPDPAALPAPSPPPAQAPEKLLSLDDVKALTQDSDFKPFMARNVGADVRNAAMKKLFTDPHYNVMDGLDIYIGDYSIADPIPESMLRQMVGAKLLKIFDDEDEKDDQALERPDLSAETDAPVPASSDSPAVDADRQAVSVLPAGVTPVLLIPPESGAEQPENSLEGTADSSTKRDQPGYLPGT